WLCSLIVAKKTFRGAVRHDEQLGESTHH
ncbi:hypothetical protein TNCT_459471, partial [Trichonephila clavata]